jgi:hypothetical protein
MSLKIRPSRSNSTEGMGACLRLRDAGSPEIPAAFDDAVLCWRHSLCKDFCPPTEAFEPERARRFAARLEVHHTPRHGRRLNLTEIELKWRETFDTLAEAERLREQAWVARLEASAAAGDRWVPTDEPEPNDDCTGSLDGHPSQEEGPRRYWFGDIGLDDTYMN